ncbi:MAG TPA: glycoside hydrolase family 3 N-terminal domain-containing protein [Gemmatimonadales bacterium]|nr:glycoside hydrolase family 3 N-terminal domain-containing protein [Gemmatimonadales bacterium]
MSRLVLLSGLVALSSGLALAWTRPSTPRDVHEHLVDSVLARMTLEEKLGQLNVIAGDHDTATAAQLALVRAGRVGGFLGVVGAKQTHEAQRVAVEESRLKIPLLLGFDVIHGYRIIYPIPLAEASSWDTATAARTAQLAALEAAAAGVNWTYAPMVDIARDPRWGRIAEGAGEDPELGSAFAAARVRGFQGGGDGGDTVGPGSVLATAKHFAAYGAAEGGRDYNTADLSERTLREVYLPPFHAAVAAGVGSVMSSFNEIGGIPSTANRWLLTSVLRDEWGFRGPVVSDWTSVRELQAHGVAGSPAAAGALALQAGVDMDMQSNIYADDLSTLVRAGEIPEATVDEAVRRVLRAKARLGLFDDPYRGPGRGDGIPFAPVARGLARKMAGEAIVLLKNDRSLLPLGDRVRRVGVIGPLAGSRAEPLGPWHALGDSGDVVTVLAGLRERAPHGTVVRYARGCAVSDTSTAGFAAAIAVARRSDVAIVVLGETADMSGEASSRSTLGLPGVQERLLEAVVRTGRPVVLVLMNGRPLALPWAAEHVPAVVETWFLGVETGHSVADVLYGDVNPSGKLPVTVPRSVGQVPIYYNHTNTGRPPSDSDHFTSRYLDLPSTPLYPFGYGLSFTEFRYSDLQLSATRIGPRDTVHVRVAVTNTGNRAGTEVVQLYVHDEVASVTRPVRQLADFRRVTLGPRERQIVELRVPPRRLGLYDQTMTFVVEPGWFRVYAGPSSVGGLEARFEVVTEK